jgi:hypothetical protein
VSAATSLAVVSLAAVAVLAVVTLRMRGRLVRVEDHARRLEHRLQTELAPGVAAARREATAAAATARDAAIAAGVPLPAPRLPFEPLTGPVVRAVAFGASAGRAIVRVAAPASARRRGLPRSA